MERDVSTIFSCVLSKNYYHGRFPKQMREFIDFNYDWEFGSCLTHKAVRRAAKMHNEVGY